MKSQSAKSPERLSFSRAAAVSAASMLVTWVMTALSFLVTPYDAEVFRHVIGPTVVIATVVPVSVAFPVALILQRGRLKLERALKELEEVHAELRTRSRVDALTGLLNREAFLCAVETSRSDAPDGAMLMLDVDHFKSINDTFGHQCGDEALKLIAQAVSDSVGQRGHVGRLGGEEFGIYLTSSDEATVFRAAEDVRLAISRIRFHPREDVQRRITASIGIALDEDGRSLSDLMRGADTNLYQAKQAGRDKVILRRAA